MKAIILFLFAFTSGRVVEEQDATVYLFRNPRFFGVIANYNVRLDGEEICKLSNKRFLKLSLKPGSHHLESYVAGVGYLSKPKTTLDFEIKEGDTYYIETTAKMKSLSSELELLQVNKKRGDELMSKITKFDYCQKRQ